MKHRLLIPLMIAVVLSSCVHDSPFRTEQYFQAMGREGEFVLTVNTRSWNILEGVLPAAVLERTDRLSHPMRSLPSLMAMPERLLIQTERSRSPREILSYRELRRSM